MSSAVRARGHQERRLVEEERAVDLRHHLPGALVRGSNHDPVRMLEVLDGGAFAQELRVGHDGEIGIRAGLADDALDLVAGADRHRRLGDDDRVAVELTRDLARRVVDVGQIGMAVAAPRRRADGDEDGIGRAHRRRRIGREKQTRLPRVLRDQIVEAGFEDRDLAAAQRLDLARVLVDAGDHVAEIGKACAGHQPDIARPDHRNAHDWMSPSRPRFGVRNSLLDRGQGPPKRR